MHYEANWSDLEDNMKFKRHIEKERLRNLTSFMDEFLAEDLFPQLVKPLQKGDMSVSSHAWG